MKAYRNTMIAVAVIFVFSLIGVILNAPYFDKRSITGETISNEVVVHFANHELVASIFAYVGLTVAVILFIVFAVKNIRQFILKKKGKLPDDTYYEELNTKTDRIFTDEEIAERKKENYIKRAYFNHHRR